MEFLNINSFPGYFSSLKIGEKVFLILFLVNFLFLLFLGKEYSKLQLTNTFYIQDVFFGLIALSSFLFRSSYRLKSIEVLIALSLLYLVFSLINFNPEVPIMLYFRQYMIFGYMAGSYFIVKAIINFKNGTVLLFQGIVIIACLSILTQIFYSCYYLISNSELPFFERNYYSPIVVLGIITIGAFVLNRYQGVKRQLLYLLVLIVSFTIGHDSAYLAIIIMYAAFYFLKVSNKFKIAISILLILCLIALLVLVPGFSDVNMSWRIIYWRDIFRLMLSNGSLFYGNGFGVPYLNEESVAALNNLFKHLGDWTVFSSPEKIFIVPPHNSFITMLFHLGIGSILLLLYPLRIFFYKRTNTGNGYIEFFLFIAFLGLSIWAFFNVILELPHSASYYWLVFFAFCFTLKYPTAVMENKVFGMNATNIHKSFQKLKAYCEKENFKGWDPYDGLNSKIFNAIPIISKSRFFRLAWIQAFKRSPINLRRITIVKKGYNAKGLGLFITGYCNLYKTDPQPEYLEKINQLSQQVIKMKSEGYSGACWGYNFDWQARAFFQPKGMPTVVATTFITEALLEAYKITKNSQYLETAKSATQFVLKDLNRTYDKKGNFSFSYSPLDKTQVFNASLLGAKLLSLVYEFTKEENLLTEAKKAVQYAANFQQKNGAWSYGTLPYHQWVDNFHTGYNLECIYLYQKISGDNSFSKHIEKGLDYYLNNFFTEKGIPKYYNNSIFPIDIHAPAQLVVTLSKLEVFKENEELINRVLNWTIENMQSEKGFFQYQKNKYFNSNIPYMRWAQAWMFYAFSYYFLESNEY